MKAEKQREAVKAFLLSCRPLFSLYGMALFCFGLVAFLLRYPFSYFLYSGLLLTVYMAIYLLWQGARYRERYQAVQHLRGDLGELERLPAGVDPLEKVYREKLDEGEQDKRSLMQANVEAKKEQLDYFTLWLHQIKTPIAAQSLLIQQMPASLEKRQLEQELIRVESYTHMALSYLKLEEHAQELDLAEVDVDALIRKVLKKYSVLFIYNYIQLDYVPTNLRVLTDGKWLEILIEQLLSNSLKYAPNGKVRIYAGTAQEDTLVIEDNGIGIRSEDLPKIFEKGYSGLNGRLHEKSSGLGLFLSRKICQRLGHEIHIDSQINEYTRVSLCMEREALPLYD